MNSAFITLSKYFDKTDGDEYNVVLEIELSEK
jgi:hypothetical protein